MKLKVLLFFLALLPTAMVWADDGDEIISDGLKYTVTNEYDQEVELIEWVDEPSGDLEIPATVNGYAVTSIGDCAFNNCQELLSVTIPASVTIIGGSAFESCTQLTSVIFAENSQLENIGGSAFGFCENLESIDIPEGVSAINTSVFDGCEALASITIPASVTYIGPYAFKGCNQVNDVYCYIADPGELEWTDYDEAFKTDGSTEFHVFDPSAWTDFSDLHVVFVSLWSVGEEFTKDGLKYKVTSTDLRTVKVLGYEGTEYPSILIIPASVNSLSVTSIGSYAFEDCYMKSVTIPGSVTSIGSYAFRGCGLLTSLTISDGVEYIFNNAFSDCCSLETIVIPASVIAIGSEAFKDCIDLETIVIGSGVESIGYDAFLRCKKVTDVFCYIPNPDQLEWNEDGCDDFKDSYATICHVAGGAAAAAAWAEKFDDVNVTFDGDLLEIMMLTDGNAYTRTTDLHVPSATYKKTISSERVGKHQAWLVPFDYTITEADAAKFNFYKINMIANSPSPNVAATNDMWVFLKPIGVGAVLHANMPYVYKPKQAVTDYEFTTPNATLKAKNTDVLLKTETTEDVYSFYATYSNTKATSSNPFYYVNINGTLSYGNSTSVTVGPYRWIIRKTNKFGGDSEYVKEMKFVVDGEVEDETSIEGLTTDNGQQTTDGWYNVNGVRLSQKPTAKGIYIHNGRKEAVR